MNTRDALSLLEALLDGVNPVTGEILPIDHVCNEPDILRALHKAVTALRHMENSPEQREPFVNRNGKLNAGRPWTQEDLRQLRQLYEDGTSIDEICRLLQRRKRGVENYLLYLGLTDAPAKGTQTGKKRARTGTPWTALDDKTLYQMWKQGNDQETIAQALERSAYAIECRLDRLGLLQQPEENTTMLQPWSPDDIRQLKEMHARGCACEAIADVLHRPVESVRARMFYTGLTKEAPFHLG